MDKAASRWGQTASQRPLPRKALPSPSARKPDPAPALQAALSAQPNRGAAIGPPKPRGLSQGIRKVTTSVQSPPGRNESVAKVKSFASTAAPSRPVVGVGLRSASTGNSRVTAGTEEPPTSPPVLSSSAVGTSAATADQSTAAGPAHVKVAVRVRPLLQAEVVSGGRSCVTHPGRGERYLAVGAGRSQRLFGFDHVFGGDATQHEVYAELVAPLVDQVLAGHNIGVLAYGQTGSGKTHSLLGSRTEEDQPRRQSFRRASSELRLSSAGPLRTVASSYNAVRSPHTLAGGGTRRTPSVASLRGQAQSDSFASPSTRRVGSAGTGGDTPVAPTPPLAMSQVYTPQLPEVAIDASAGLVARFVADLWLRLTQLRDRFSVRVTASMLELYGEDVLDLLADDVLAFIPTNTARGSPGGAGGATRGAAQSFEGAAFGDFAGSGSRALRQREPLSIREDKARGTVVVGLRSVRVRSAAETLDVLRTGLRNRTTASTVLNDLSSRSHLVFLLQVDARNIVGPDSGRNATPEVRGTSPDSRKRASGSAAELSDATLFDEKLQLAWSSKIAFSDLAGSERLTKTQARGIEMKEGIGINSGLLALSNVIAALSARAQAQHVPYRASKLTRILAEYLGGQAVTVFLACLNPSEESMDETLQTIRYADRAKQIRVDSSRLTHDSTHAHIAQLRKHIALLRLDTVMRHFQLSRRDALARLRAAAAGKDDEVDRFILLLHSFVTGWGQLFDGAEDLSLSFAMFVRKSSVTEHGSSSMKADIEAVSKVHLRADNGDDLGPASPGTTIPGLLAESVGIISSRTESTALTFTTGRSIMQPFNGDFMAAGLAPVARDAVSADWLTPMDAATEHAERLQSSLDVQYAEQAIQRHLSDLSARLEDLDARAAVTANTLALLSAQENTLKAHLHTALSTPRIAGESERCHRALLACRARQLQGEAELASLSRSREALVSQHDRAATERRIMLNRLKEQRSTSVADGGDPRIEETAAFSSDTEERSLAQLLVRVQRRSRERMGGSGGTRALDHSTLAAVFEPDVSARVRLLAAEDRLVFELTKRADLLRSMDEALRRRRAAEVEVHASRSLDEENVLGNPTPAQAGDVDYAEQPVQPASEAAARLRVVDEEVETLDMRLGVVESRVREAAAELRLLFGGADDPHAVGSMAHITGLSNELSSEDARRTTAELVSYVCDLRAQLRAAQMQHGASEQALRLVMQETEGLRRSLRSSHDHWAAQIARLQHAAADHELGLVRALAAGDDNEGSGRDFALRAVLRRLEEVETENKALRDAHQRHQPQDSVLTTGGTLLRMPSAFDVIDDPSCGGVARRNEPTRSDPQTRRPHRDSLLSVASRSTFTETPGRHPFLVHCDAVLGIAAGEGGSPAQLSVLLHSRVAQACELAVKAHDLCAGLGLDVASAVAFDAARRPEDSGSVREAVVAIFGLLHRIPSALLSPSAAVIVRGVCGDSTTHAISRPLAGTAVSLQVQSPAATIAPLPSALVADTPMATPEDIKAMVRARVRARVPASRQSSSTSLLSPTDGNAPTLAAAGSPLLAHPPLPPHGVTTSSASQSPSALRHNPLHLDAERLPDDWLLGGPSLCAQAFCGLRPGDMSSASLDSGTDAVTKLAVIHATRRSDVARIIRTVARVRQSEPREHSGRRSGNFTYSIAAARTAVALSCAMTQNALPSDALYRALEALVAAFADDAASVTQVLDSVRSWRGELGWPPLSERAAPHHHLDEGLWARLLSWLDAEAHPAAASPFLEPYGAALSAVSWGGESALDPLPGPSSGLADDAAMLHVVALALLAAGAVTVDAADAPPDARDVTLALMQNSPPLDCVVSAALAVALPAAPADRPIHLGDLT